MYAITYTDNKGVRPQYNLELPVMIFRVALVMYADLLPHMLCLIVNCDARHLAAPQIHRERDNIRISARGRVNS